MPPIVISICAGVFVAAALIVAQDQRGGLAWALYIAAWMTLVASGLGSTWVLSRLQDGGKPWRFLLSRNGFGAPSVQTPDLVALPMMTWTGYGVAITVGAWRDGDPPRAWAFAAAIVLGLALVSVRLARWPAHAIELTPSGITRHGAFFSRAIPWAALAPGGLPRPRLADPYFELTLTRDGKTRRRKFRVAHMDIDPWLLADAIRWYVDHPADRAEIGTRAGLDALMAQAQPPSWQRRSGAPTAKAA